MGFDFEQANLELEKARNELWEYLLNSYKTEPEALEMHAYLNGVLERICKRQSYEIKISGGSPIWHSDIYALLSRLIECEDRVGQMLYVQLEELEDG